MISSRFKIYGIITLFGSIVLCIVIVLFVYILISVVFLDNHIVPRGTLPRWGSVVLSIILILFLPIIINSWIRYAFDIKIYPGTETIAFKNLLTRREKIYSFADFDGYLTTYVTAARIGDFKDIYLVKNNRIEKIITGFYYSNVDQMLDAVSAIEDLGFHKDFSELARKALLNRPVFPLKKP